HHRPLIGDLGEVELRHRLDGGRDLRGHRPGDESQREHGEESSVHESSGAGFYGSPPGLSTKERGRIGPRRLLDCAPLEVSVGKLEELLTAPERRKNVVADCVRLIDQEVDARTGLSGLAIKGAYRVAKAVRSGFVDDAVDRLLPRFLAQLEP